MKTLYMNRLGTVLLSIMVSLMISSHLSGVDFTGIPTANSLEKAENYRKQREQAVLDYWSTRKPQPYPINPDTRGRFTTPAISSVLTKTNLDLVNQIILDPATKKWAKYGSSADIGGICVRKGDYDFTAQALIRMAYIHRGDTSVLWPETQRKIATTLLPANGTEHYLKFGLGICGIHEDTENHILMIETSRYLTNQLLMDDPELREPKYDNSTNGFDPWILDHLQTYFKNGFSEYNSKPYEKYSMLPINNLYNYADTPKVRLASGMLLDMTAATFAVQSNGLRRATPFRRQFQYEGVARTWISDGEAARYALLVGNHKYLTGVQRPYIKRSKLIGGNGGKAFNDTKSLSEFPLVAKLSINSGKRLDAVKFTYHDQLNFDYNDQPVLNHGSKSGNWKHLDLERNEYFSKMEVHSGNHKDSTRIFYLKATTNKGRILKGGTPTDNRNIYEAPAGWKITGFQGRSGAEIDQLGVLYTPIDYMYADLSKKLKVPGAGYMLDVLSSGYEVPDLIKDLMINKEQNHYFQKFKHLGVELYHSSSNYLISAGGVFINYFKYGSKEQHGWARPITVMPSKDPGTDLRNWIRIYGNQKRMRRYNHTVYKNFGAGANVIVPESIPDACREKSGNWEFFDFTADNCALQYGFYVAVHKKACDSKVCRDQGSNYGFFETREAKEITFDDFKTNIINSNKDREWNSSRHNFYQKSNGEMIEFIPVTTERFTWGIVSVDGEAQQRDINQWPLAEGDIINADEGRVEITNPKLNQTLILDMTDPQNPKRSLR